MPGNPLVRFDEGRVGRTFGVALSPTLPPWRETNPWNRRPNYNRSSRVSASPKRSSLIPMRSIIERYKLHILRFPSPAFK